MDIKMPPHFTKTDMAPHEWAIDDEVTRLREWGKLAPHPLPLPPVDECSLGAADDCAIRLHDASGRVSRRHARLIRDNSRWILRDAGSKNGLRVDGARRKEVILEPGLEIG